MVKFLINRPVAVIMTFLAVMMLGIVSSGRLPVSLMPDIDIPEITVSVNRPDVSAREIENSIVAVLRRNLIQVPGINDLKTESRNGSAILRLSFQYGTDINMAFMEVNEKIDAAMNGLPRDIHRPRVIKASATDLPVFMLNLGLKGEEVSGEGFLELSEFAETVIRRRIEQLPEVAMADITGQVRREIYVIPREEKMRSLDITENDIRVAIERNNITIGSILVKDGKYLYNLEFSSYLRDLDDIRNIFIRAGDRIVRLEEVAETGIREELPTGSYYNGDKRSVILAIIKQSTARMSDLEKQLDNLLGQFRSDYPRIEFEISQDQTTILDFSLSNLKQNLIAGGTLAFLLMFLFLRDAKSPLLVGLSIPASLVVSLLFFHIAGLSVNIISLSGLILGVGMMIDNSIIVTDNICQYIDRGEPLPAACIKGTNEVIRPLISSVLTTCAVFIPLIFLSGMAGALFYDQAIAITIGLLVSLVVAITLLPVVYRLLYLSGREGTLTRLIRKISFRHIENSYEKGMRYFFRVKGLMLAGFFLVLALMVFMFMFIEKEKFPAVRHNEIVLSVDWNENIDIEENRRRVYEVLSPYRDEILQINAFIGEQQFLFSRGYEQSYTEAKVYIRVSGFEATERIERTLAGGLLELYPAAMASVAAQENIFEKLFSADEIPLMAEVSLLKEKQVPEVERMIEIIDILSLKYPDAGISYPALEDKVIIRLDPEKMLLYDLSATTVYNRLRTAFNENHAGELRSSSEVLAIKIGEKEKSINEIISFSTVVNSRGVEIPVSEVARAERMHGYKTIAGGMYSEYVPLAMDFSTRSPARLTREIRSLLAENPDIDVKFSGALITGQQTFRELTIVLAIALLLLFFILAAQFESLLLPLIVLIEIPIDIAGALVLLLLFGETLNLMSMIGLIVMSGIIINDSILKIDTINRLRIEGMPVMDSIYTGGSRRLKPIIMTSLTTILATVFFIFGNDIGSELQKPLALAVIGGMSLGTFVSLYFIPLAYWALYGRSTKGA
ncbi:MAG: efflux RND transporter permease subunit [Bacteroidales bacterium]|jgi:multidrug efflux pump subunit AcrB|nr:efflux RND transporter permease subunit [Bacteroidales bacterium]